MNVIRVSLTNVTNEPNPNQTHKLRTKSEAVCVAQAGGPNNSRDVTIPAAITRLFKSALDWNLYSDKVKDLNERKVPPSSLRFSSSSYGVALLQTPYQTRRLSRWRGGPYLCPQPLGGTSS